MGVNSSNSEPILEAPPTSKIEAYLNSLPEDTESIYISYKNLIYFPNLSRFTPLHI